MYYVYRSLWEFSPDFRGIFPPGGELRLSNGGECDGIDGVMMAR
jgi:hypothetical protein